MPEPTATTIELKLSDENRRRIQVMKQLYPQSRSSLLPALHIVQEQFGYVPAPAMEEVAEILGILAGEVEQVVTFYRMYNQKPVGQFHIKVCDSISCYLRGADELIEQGLHKLNTSLNQTSPDGKITLSKIECLAACGAAPCLQVNDEFVYNVSPQQFDEMLDRLKTAQDNPYYLP